LGEHQTKCIEMWFDLKERTLECDFEDCDKSLSTKPQLEDHKKRHLGFKKFKCNSSECHKSFVTTKELKRHTNYVHNNNKLFNCDQSLRSNHSQIIHLWRNSWQEITIKKSNKSSLINNKHILIALVLNDTNVQFIPNRSQRSVV